MSVFTVTIISKVTVDTDEISLVGEDRANVNSIAVTDKILDDIKAEVRDALEGVPYLYPQSVIANKNIGR